MRALPLFLRPADALSARDEPASSWSGAGDDERSDAPESDEAMLSSGLSAVSSERTSSEQVVRGQRRRVFVGASRPVTRPKVNFAPTSADLLPVHSEPCCSEAGICCNSRAARAVSRSDSSPCLPLLVADRFVAAYFGVHGCPPTQRTHTVVTKVVVPHAVAWYALVRRRAVLRRLCGTFPDFGSETIPHLDQRTEAGSLICLAAQGE